MSPVEWDAHAYESVARPQLDWGLKLLASRAWRGDERVLDAGCGPGTLAKELLLRVPRGRVTCIDNDKAMVERAKARLAADAGRVRILQGDIQHLEQDETYDVIFSNAVLHWVPDHDAVFATFLKHLRPGGEILVQCGGEGNLERIRGLAAELMKEPAFSAHFRDWTSPWHYEDDASTQERLLIAGFIHPKVTLDPAPTPFPDAASFRTFGETVVLLPYLQRLPTPALRAAFLDEFMRRVGSRPQDLAYDYVRLNVRAQRSPNH